MPLINEKVNVIVSFDAKNGIIMPEKICWHGRDYLIKKINYYHRIRLGRNILHIFHVTDGTIDFRLQLDTTNLHWLLEEIYDGTCD